MSAYIVSRASIDALVLAGYQWGLRDREELDRLGRVLWSENLASVAFRYPEDGDGDRPGPNDFRDAHAAEYTLGAPEIILDGGAVLGVIAGYTYQSCEHAGWQISEANAFCCALKAEIEETGATEDRDTWDLTDLMDAAVVDV